MIVKEYAKLMRLELKFFLLDSSVSYREELELDGVSNNGIKSYMEL